VNRLEHTPGTQIITGSELENDLGSAPGVSIGYTGKKYPHVYRNRDVPRLLRRGSYHEFPVGPYPYKLQNSKGYVPAINPIGNSVRADKGYMRIVTDRYKNIKAVIYHPLNPAGPVTTFLRATEIIHWRAWLAWMVQWPGNTIVHMYYRTKARLAAAFV
jgi:hypothetical protein